MSAEVNAISQLIGNLGFPIAAFLLIWWEHRTTLRELTKALDALRLEISLMHKSVPIASNN